MMIGRWLTNDYVGTHRMLIRLRLCLLLIILSLFARTTCAQPDLILHNGKIVTVDESFTTAQAIAVRGDRIQDVGDNDRIRRLAGPATVQIDLQGRTVIPGLCDSHVHAPAASMYEFDHPIPEMDTVADVLKYVASRAQLLPEGNWIIVRQVFITRLRDQRYPTRKELDAVAPKHPVMFSTGPDCVCNSLALTLSGIDRDFQITDGQSGQIERDPVTGELTGILRNASRFVKSKPNEKSPTLAERTQQLKQLFADYNAVGLTSIADRAASDDGIEAYSELRRAGSLTCRVFLSYNINGNASREDVEKAIKKAASHPLHEYNSQLWLRGIKVFLDGGMLTGSAFMRKPWGLSQIYSITDPEYRGIRFIDHERLVHLAERAMKHDLQFTAHAVGDGAVHALIDAYAEINKQFPVRRSRPCITHCNFMSLEAIRQMQDLGIVADLQPVWLWLDGATLNKHFGEDRLEYFQPYKTLFDHKVVVGGGSDHMQRIGSLRSVNPYNPFLGMWTVLSRQPRRSDQRLHPEQSITREQALRLYTINNAWLTFEEHQKGSLEPGKLADFVVLNADLLTCPVDEVKSMTVNQTYVGGRRVYPLTN
jgi:predicted amidohydrolase YtcJ